MSNWASSVEDIDIWRTARLIQRQRDQPEMYAGMRADELLAAGDPEGCRVWQRIGMAVRNLSERVPVCPHCRGSQIVCEDHPTRPMNHDGCGSAGMPCACNTEATGNWDDGRPFENRSAPG